MRIRHIGSIFASFLCISLIFVKSEARAQSYQDALSEINFSTPEDKKKFEALPMQIQQMVFNRTPPEPPTPEIIAKSKIHSIKFITRNNKLAEGSKEWEFLKARIMSDSPIVGPAGPGSKGPLQHLRFKEGNPLPTKSEIDHEQQQLLVKAREARTKKIQKYNNDVVLAKAIPNGMNAANVVSKPQCTSSSTATLAIPPDFVAEGRSIDMLFFNGKPPFDVKTTIGKSTDLIVFGEAESAERSAPYATLKIDCLPFRLRSTGKEVTYAKGALALKNYDANPEASGTFDPTIKKYIQQIGLEATQ